RVARTETPRQRACKSAADNGESPASPFAGVGAAAIPPRPYQTTRPRLGAVRRMTLRFFSKRSPARSRSAFCARIQNFRTAFDALARCGLVRLRACFGVVVLMAGRYWRWEECAAKTAP